VPTPTPTRRSFLKTAAVTSSVLAFPHVMRSQPGSSPNNRLNVACVGIGGRGAAAVSAMKNENIVALCDVDEARAAKTLAAHQGVPHFRDFRRMLEKWRSRSTR
jgi:Zn-dependent alcohol dehydrogenase